jgi:hypothetical protein
MDQMDKPWKFTAVRAVMAAATLLYLPLVMPVAGPPRWRAPWWPSAGRQGSFAFTMTVTLALWAYGWFLLPWLSRRKLRSSAAAAANKFENAAFVSFFVRAALLYSGSPAGAGLSFESHDSRYAIIFAAVSALLILLLPKPKSRDTTIPST